MLGGVKRAMQLGGDLQILCDQEQFLKLLSLTGLDKVLAVHPSLEAFVGNRQLV